MRKLHYVIRHKEQLDIILITVCFNSAVVEVFSFYKFVLEKNSECFYSSFGNFFPPTPKIPETFPPLKEIRHL